MELKSLISTHFTEPQLWIVFLAIIFLLISILLFVRKRTTLSIVFLFASGFTLRLFAASLDPFLNCWDEQFHALVAKNLIAHPFKPMLVVDPILPYNYTDWCSNHIWLHKQPWFLWQMAVFLKVFGINEFALRLPMAITLSLLIPVIFRMGKILVSPAVGWYGAFLYATSFFFINHATGWPMLDHNDAAFLFYITLSIWSYIEFRNSGRMKWVILIGLFSGIAILNKWLAGLLVYSGWFISILAVSKGKEIFLEMKPLLTALGITLLTAIPWQVYTALVFPREFTHEMSHNLLHFSSTLGSYAGDSWYHIEMIRLHYGTRWILLLMVPAVFTFMKMISDRRQKIAIPVYILFTYLFFTLASTKMPMFTSIVSSLLFLSLGALFHWLTDFFSGKIRPWFYSVVLFSFLCVAGYANLDLQQLDKLHTDQRADWEINRQNTEVMKTVSKWIPSSDYVVFNCGGWNTIAFLFYNSNRAYGFYPDENTYKDLKTRGIKMATLTDQGLPVYLLNDPEVIKIPVHLTLY